MSLKQTRAGAIAGLPGLGSPKRLPIPTISEVDLRFSMRQYATGTFKKAKNM